MLFEDSAVEPKTLVLLKTLGGFLCGGERDFALVGDTALAIQLRHRRSIDLDFFCPGPFQAEELLQTVVSSAENDDLVVLAAAENTLNLSIGGIMIDLIRYDYARLEPLVQADGYSMLALPDIAAMKLSAISNRGSKKDFFDIDRLLEQFELTELLDFYQRKFETRDTFHVLRSLAYFEDAEEEPDPVILADQTWEDVKTRTMAAIRNLK